MGGALLITNDAAFPPISGADHRNWQHAVALTRLMSVTLASVQPARHPESVAGTGVALVALSSARPGKVQAFQLGPLVPSFEQMVRDSRPEVLIIEGVDQLPLITPAVRNLVPRIVLDMHNIESALLESLRRNRRWWRRMDPRLRRDVQKMEDLERSATDLVDQVWVCSRDDAERLDPAIALPVHVIPNGIPNPERLPGSLPAATRAEMTPSLLFAGHLGYKPNVLAAERLVSDILPLVHKALPAATVTLAGRQTSTRVRKLAQHMGVTVLTDPPDMAPILAGADIAVVPLTLGGGTRLKILEAMANGLPVVATSLAVEGLGLQPDVHYLTAETDTAFAVAIDTMVRDRERRERMRAAAFDFVRAHFSQSEINRRIAFALS